jgi:hypothetical protein
LIVKRHGDGAMLRPGSAPIKLLDEGDTGAGTWAWGTFCIDAHSTLGCFPALETAVASADLGALRVAFSSGRSLKSYEPENRKGEAAEIARLRQLRLTTDVAKNQALMGSDDFPS